MNGKHNIWPGNTVLTEHKPRPCPQTQRRPTASSGRPRGSSHSAPKGVFPMHTRDFPVRTFLTYKKQFVKVIQYCDGLYRYMFIEKCLFLYMYNVLSRKITCQWLLNSTEFSKSLENVYGWYMLVCFCLFLCCYPTVLWMISQYDYVTWKYHSSEPALPSPPNPSMPVDFLPPSNEMQYSNVLRATPALGLAPGARMEPRGKWFSLV